MTPSLLDCRREPPLSSDLRVLYPSRLLWRPRCFFAGGQALRLWSKELEFHFAFWLRLLRWDSWKLQTLGRRLEPLPQTPSYTSHARY